MTLIAADTQGIFFSGSVVSCLGHDELNISLIIFVIVPPPAAMVTSNFGEQWTIL